MIKELIESLKNMTEYALEHYIIQETTYGVYKTEYLNTFHSDIVKAQNLLKLENIENKQVIGELIAGSYSDDEVVIKLKIKRPTNISIEMGRKYTIGLN